MRRPIWLMSYFILLCVSLAGGEAQAIGRLAAARAARTADAGSAAASLPAPEIVQPLPAASPVAYYPSSGLIYRHRGHNRAGYGCAPPIQTVLTATNPCTCCPVAIPVCVPACCVGAPSVSCHRGLFGASVIDFDWACGYRVTVRFKHNGQVVVVSRG
jgi:hypothetical protein